MIEGFTKDEVEKILEEFIDFCNFDEQVAEGYQLRYWLSGIAAKEKIPNEFISDVAQKITDNFRNEEMDYDDQFQNNLSWLEEAYEHAYEQVRGNE